MQPFMSLAVRLAGLVLVLGTTAEAFVGGPHVTPFRARPTNTRLSSTPVPVKEKTRGGKLAGLLVNHRSTVDALEIEAPGACSEMERLRLALQFDTLEKASQAMQERLAWRNGPGKAICEAAAAAVEAATADGTWNNEPVYGSAPHADRINRFITPRSVMTLSTVEGDLVYVIRASLINDKELMDQVSVEEVGDYFLYAKEVHNLVADRRSVETGRLCQVIFANDISGVRKAPDGRFSKALTSSSDQYEVLYPSLAGPTMILNLPFILQAFVGLLKPLFPKSVQERLVFTKAPVLAKLKELTPLANDPVVKAGFVAEIKGLLP
jgi:hypothetical protein